jgi:hypothetical protein
MVNANQPDFEDFEDPSDEDLDDIHVGGKSLAGAVLYNTDWTVETIVNQVTKGSIDLAPKFQRRDAWNIHKKSLFIESILLNFPVPPLTLAERGNSKTYIVVDGKQRLTTLAQFFGLMPDSVYNRFRLAGLKELDNVNGMAITELSLSNPAVITTLENYTIRTNVIRGWRKDDVLYSIFLRLNSGSVKLSPQELRQALIPGPFSDFMVEYANHSRALRSIFPGAEPDFRMRDLELILRYLGFQFFISSYRGNLKSFLDHTAKDLNENWFSVEQIVREKCQRFELAYDCVVEAFGKESAFRKWTGDRWENRLNRAVFDVMMFYLRDDRNTRRFSIRSGDLVERFKLLCSTNFVFRDALETTTKSIDAVYYRLAIWGDSLKEFDIIEASSYINSERVIDYDVP